MEYMRLLPVLLLIIYPLYIRGEDRNGIDLTPEDDKTKASDLANLFLSFQNISFKVFDTLAQLDAGKRTDKAYEELKSMVATLTDVVRAQGERIEEQQENIRDLRKGLDKRLRENEVKIEWALTDGTLAPKNTSGVMKNLARQEEKIDRSLDMLREVHGFTYPAASCAEINGRNAQGVHAIYPNHAFSNKVLANCATTAGGGWTVIQKRFDGSVDFYRGWEEYAKGFGDLAGEHWLGLRHIHALTKDQPMELYVGLTDFDQVFKYAKYASFSVSSEAEKFRLHIGSYSGNAGDSLWGHNGFPFSTKDQDNDSWPSHCSITFHGAWWYYNCHSSNLNGLYSKVKVDNPKYMTWYGLHNAHRAMKTSVMMIRPANFKP